MLGGGLQFGPSHSDDPFYGSAAVRRPYHHLGGGGGSGLPENGVGSSRDAAVALACNISRFLESTTPSVPVQSLDESKAREWRAGDGEYVPYFVLEDLWNSFKEWSAYGAGVPLLLNGMESVVQYYVPSLSGIQLYGKSTGQVISDSRRIEEERVSDCFGDSSGDGSSDGEVDRGVKSPRDCDQNHLECDSTLQMDRKFPDGATQEGSLNDGREGENSRCPLLFEYFEQDSPYSRETFVDKVLDLTRGFPELKTLRSCDLSSSSWMSVAWYPIYRIPMGPTLKDLDACFLTFHSLSTPDAGNPPCSALPHPQGVHTNPLLSLRIFGLASYKLKGSTWMPNGGYDEELVSTLRQAADNWLRCLQVEHPDYCFFASNGQSRHR